MATAVIPDTDRLNPEFARLAKHYGVDVAICPPHRPQRKGVVEAAIRLLGERWWRTARVTSMGSAQQHLDAWSVRVSDARLRRGSTVGELGAAEPLRALPALAYPAEIRVERRVSRSALVAFDANRYSVPPAHADGASRSAPVSASRTCGSSPPPARSSPRTAARWPAPGRSSAAQSTPPPWNTRSSMRSPPSRRVGGARSTARPATGRSPSSPRCTATRPPRRRRPSSQALRRLGRGLLMADTAYHQLREHLAYLRLSAIAERLAPALAHAAQHPPGYPSSCATCSPPKSPPSRSVDCRAGCGSPSCRRARRSSSSTSPPSPRWIGAWSRTSRRCGSSTTARTSC